MSIFVQSDGSALETGPVRSGLRSRIGLGVVSVSDRPHHHLQNVFRRQKTKGAELSEIGFPQISRQCDLFLGGKRPFKVLHFLKNVKL